MATPSEALTEKILPLLVEGKLVRQKDTEKYKAKLASGRMKVEDWLMLAENVADKEVK